jgi:hypothetical protein
MTRQDMEGKESFPLEHVTMFKWEVSGVGGCDA